MDVSIIVPLYKGNKYIESILKSMKDNYIYVNSKRKCSMELILVNDYPDESIVFPETYDIPIRLVTNPENRGIHFSRVRGLGCADGTFVLFLDQDDDIEETYIYSQLSKAEDADVIVCNGIWRRTKKIMPDEAAIEKVEDAKRYFSTLAGIVSPGQALIRKKSIPCAWSEHIMQVNYCDDLFLWLLLKNANAKFIVNNEILYHHNETSANTSFNWEQNARSLREMYQIITDNKLLTEENQALLNVAAERKIDQHTRYDRIEKGLAKAKANREVFLNYFIDHKYSKVAIYGYGILGQKLKDVLLEIERDIVYVIDRDFDYLEDKTVRLKHLGDDLEYVDVIIVTPVSSYNSIQQSIEKYVDYKVVSLEEIIEGATSSSQNA